MDTIAGLIATFLDARAVGCVFGLQGGHIQPVWDRAARLGIRFVDARDERAAVHMAHAYAELAGGLGVAMVTAGPGVTNAITAVANAHSSRVPLLLIGGAPPRAQAGAGALQDLPHVELLRPVTRLARSVGVARQAPRLLDEAVTLALGDGGEPGPVFLEFPTDVLRETLPDALVLEEHLRPKPARTLPPDPQAVARAVDALWTARRPLVIAGRGARGAGSALVRLLDAIGAPYLDTPESRGLVPEDHPSVVAAMRGAAMREAELVLLVGRRLDFQLAYGSPAVFPDAKFVRISEAASELRDNRRGVVEILATPSLALKAMVEAAGNRTPGTDRAWAQGLRAKHLERNAKLKAEIAEIGPGSDGYMHPYRLLGSIQDALDADSIVIVDGGDILSFARIALSARTYMDTGPLGCLGVGVPFGVAAALACPGRKVLSLSGDGAFGFNAMEIDTAARHGARAVFVVANNGAWNIDRTDQRVNYEGRIEGTELRRSDYAGVARALGLHGERIEDAADLPGALQRAFAEAPALLDVPITRDAVSPDAKSGLAGVPDLQPLSAWDAAERARGTSEA